MEITRQTALVMEDMLKVVSGDLSSYPFHQKKNVNHQRRAVSLNAKNVFVRQQKAPDEQLSNLKKQRVEDQHKAEEQEKLDREQKDIARIKRSIYLKQRIAESQSQSAYGDKVGGNQRGVMAGGGRALSEKKGGRRGGNMTQS